MSRKDYIAFVVKARTEQSGISVARAQKDAERIWRLKTVEQKDQWKEVLEEVARCSEEVGPALIKAMENEENARRLLQDAKHTQGINREDDNYWLLAVQDFNSAAQAYDKAEEKSATLYLAIEKLADTAFWQYEHPDLGLQEEQDSELEYGICRAARKGKEVMLEKAEHLDVPQRADGTFKIAEEWISPKRLLARQTQRKDALKQTTKPETAQPGETWEGSWIVGEGAYGTVGLFVQLDAENQVVDRIVRKDNYSIKKYWDQIQTFDGNPRDATQRQVNEIACNQAMNNIPSKWVGMVKVPEVLASRVEEKDMFYVLYFPWFPGGDMDHTMLRQYNHFQMAVCEPILWYIFYTLAEAVEAMAEGRVRAGEESLDWNEIVHRDIKPTNILLGDPTPGHFDDYPTPYLADFGIAFRTWDGDQLNPEGFMNCGTPGYMAPEMVAYVDRETLQPMDRFKMGSHTNVWGIGMVMYSLMCQDNNPPNIDYLGDGTEYEWQVRENLPAGHPYSEELINLIRQCIVFDPSKRPTSSELLLRIETAIDEQGADLADGMRHPGIVHPIDRAVLRWRFQRRDEYAVGLSRDELPEQAGE